MPSDKRKKTGFHVFYGENYDVDEVKIRFGKPKGRVKKCAKVVVEFADGSKRKVRICEDSVEEYTEE